MTIAFLEKLIEIFKTIKKSGKNYKNQIEEILNNNTNGIPIALKIKISKCASIDDIIMLLENEINIIKNKKSRKP
ncbi:MAG: hypothetical protein LBI28_03555 [Treponema sp.]|jgi:hypothetical protein|nr:hypothetical protein [Treponema sp.]